MSNSSPKPRGRLLRHPLVLTAAAALVVAVGLGAYWFQPWKLFTNTIVDEALPTATAPASPGAPAATEEPAVVSQGSLISHEHETTGTVRLLRLPDDSLVLRVQDLNTSDGPDLHVVMSDQPVIEGTDGWHAFGQGRSVDLGPLKGNRGSANYPVPADVDVSGLDSVSIWCERFGVSFGAAELAAPA